MRGQLPSLGREAAPSGTEYLGKSVAISGNGKCRRSNQRSYKLVTSKWIAMVGVYVYALYILTRYTHKYLIYKK